MQEFGVDLVVRTGGYYFASLENDDLGRFVLDTGLLREVSGDVAMVSDGNAIHGDVRIVAMEAGHDLVSKHALGTSGAVFKDDSSSVLEKSVALGSTGYFPDIVLLWMEPSPHGFSRT